MPVPPEIDLASAPAVACTALERVRFPPDRRGDRSLDSANFPAAIAILVIASISFFGIGTMTAVLPLVSPEKGTRLGFVAQGKTLVVSGVYSPVEVLPGWMQGLATISPATSALEGIRGAIRGGEAVHRAHVWPLLLIGAVSIALGPAVLNRGEAHAKRNGKSKRNG